MLRYRIACEITFVKGGAALLGLCFQTFADRNNHLIYDVCVEFAQNYNISIFGSRGSFGCQRRRVRRKMALFFIDGHFFSYFGLPQSSIGQLYDGPDKNQVALELASGVDLNLGLSRELRD